MTRFHPVVCVALMLLVGCSSDGEPQPVANDYELTPPITSRSPENTEGGPPSERTDSWYVNDDRTIWMLNQNWVPGKRTKTAWFRPARTQIEATGRRLDGDAPPLVFSTPPGDSYRHRFTPSSMTFPEAGVWEITAKAGGSEARFVVEVRESE